MAGEGGEDSKLFCHDLFTAYVKYAVNNHLVVEILNDESGHIVAKISGTDAGKIFKNETGKHIIQRVPPTESKGRRQTSVVAVAIMPLPPDNTMKQIPLHELEITTQCGHGPGGQHQNKTASAVRMKHIPTGIQVFINGRDQHANKRDATRIITAKVNDYVQNKEQSVYSKMRKELMDGNRGNKIRTYNLIDSRVTDHRTNKKISNVDAVLKKGQFELLSVDINV
jgi:peptide chain release factor 1